MPVKLNCVTCEKEFFVDPYRIKQNARFCSKRCFNVKWESKHIFNCQNCGKEHIAFGYTKGRKKYCSRQCMEEFKHTPIEQKIKKSYIIEANGCWRWIKSFVLTTGYGKLDHKGKTYSAHRESYKIFKGEIPKGKHICHSCDNKWCINPDHLWIGTQKQNIQDMIAKGRKPNLKGKNVKYSNELIILIRKLKNEGKTYVQINDLTKVPISTCVAYINGRRRL